MQHIPSARRRCLLRGAGAMLSLAVAAPGGARAAVPSALITLMAPAVADDGALVPVSVASALPGTCEILLLVDTNPEPLVAQFTIPPGTEPFVATRIRMAGNGTLTALVRTDDGLFAARRAIEVSIGGCG